MSELVTARIRATAAKLGLPHLTETLTGHVEWADAAQMGYLDFLDLILEEELAVREERRLGTRCGPPRCRITRRSTNTTSPTSPNSTRARSGTATPAFAEAKGHAALLGPPGVGKTHLAVALAVAACRAW